MFRTSAISLFPVIFPLLQIKSSTSLCFLLSPLIWLFIVFHSFLWICSRLFYMCFYEFFFLLTSYSLCNTLIASSIKFVVAFSSTVLMSMPLFLISSTFFIPVLSSLGFIFSWTYFLVHTVYVNKLLRVSDNTHNIYNYKLPTRILRKKLLMILVFTNFCWKFLLIKNSSTLWNKSIVTTSKI